jgi:hypothetical protein
MKFKIHWLTGEPTIVEGPTIAQAMMLAGFGGGITAAIDWYEELKEGSYNEKTYNETNSQR